MAFLSLMPDKNTKDNDFVFMTNFEISGTKKVLK